MSKVFVIKDIPSTSALGQSYDIIVDQGENFIFCTCKGFQVHKRCKHTKFYKPLIKAILKSGERDAGKSRSSSA